MTSLVGTAGERPGGGAGDLGSRAAAPPRGATPIMVGLVVAGVLYNAVLAAANANGAAQSFNSVAVVEFLILGLAAARILTLPRVPTDALPLALLYAGVLCAAYVSLCNGVLSIENLRNVVVIVLFAMIGSRLSERQLQGLFRWLSLVVAAFLVVEIVDTPLYVRIFEPARYYLNTRGIPLFSLDSSGLFRSALGFKGRFSFGLSSHRTSSIFIEQVSLANYAGVLCIFLISRFPRLTRRDRLLHVSLVVLILLSNDTRTSISLSLVCLAGYVVFPRLAPGAAIAVMPLVLSAGALLTAVLGASQGDNFRGRISLTIEHLAGFDLDTFLGLRLEVLTAQLDSGYSYLIAGMSVFGLLAFWLFCALAMPERTPEQRRCLIAANLYVFMNLMIGGTAIFSIKVAAPLWVLIGFMRTTPDGPVPPEEREGPGRDVRILEPTEAR